MKYGKPIDTGELAQKIAQMRQADAERSEKDTSAEEKAAQAETESISVLPLGCGQLRRVTHLPVSFADLPDNYWKTAVSAMRFLEESAGPLERGEALAFLNMVGHVLDRRGRPVADKHIDAAARHIVEKRILPLVSGNRDHLAFAIAYYRNDDVRRWMQGEADLCGGADPVALFRDLAAVTDERIAAGLSRPAAAVAFARALEEAVRTDGAEAALAAFERSLARQDDLRQSVRELFSGFLGTSPEAGKAADPANASS